MFEPNEMQIVAAIDAAETACRDLELTLKVPPEFVLDVLINSTLHDETVRPDYVAWVRGVIHRLPNISTDQKQVLLALTGTQ